MSVGTGAFCVDSGPPGSLREPEPRNATLFRSKVFTEVMKIKQGHADEPSSDAVGVFTERGTFRYGHAEGETACGCGGGSARQGAGLGGPRHRPSLRTLSGAWPATPDFRLLDSGTGGELRSVVQSRSGGGILLRWLQSGRRGLASRRPWTASHIRG